MATEASKILEGGRASEAMRGNKYFLTYNFAYPVENTMPEIPLIGGYINNETDHPYASFWPEFSQNILPSRRIPFKDWWRRDVIYRAEAFETGAFLPREQRRTMTREHFVRQMRNTLGAHIDPDQHEELETLQRADAYGIILDVCDEAGKILLTTEDGSLPVRVGPAAAMMRQIAFEVLNAYGLEEERPAQQIAGLPNAKTLNLR